MKTKDAIKAARKARKMTLAQVGEQLGGITRQSVHEYESGRKDPTVGRLKDLQKIFGVVWFVDADGLNFKLKEKL